MTKCNTLNGNISKCYFNHLWFKLQVHRFPPLTTGLTKGLQWLHQSKSESFVFRQFLKQAGNFVVSYSDYVASVNALNVVTDTNDFRAIHHTALFNTLPGEKDNEQLIAYKTLKSC